MAEQSVIMLVEDREDDIVLIKRAFKHAMIHNAVQVVRDGNEAIFYLAGEGQYANRAEYPLPDLILLDLKMPKTDGFAVLRWVREQPEFSLIRVVVLTSSDSIRDVNQAYALGANSFMVKPVEFENIVELAKVMETYWLRHDRPPEARRPGRSAPTQGTKIS